VVAVLTVVDEDVGREAHRKGLSIGQVRHDHEAVVVPVAVALARQVEGPGPGVGLQPVAVALLGRAGERLQGEDALNDVDAGGSDAGGSLGNGGDLGLGGVRVRRILAGAD
jgi:hypothetical protein